MKRRTSVGILVGVLSTVIVVSFFSWSSTHTGYQETTINRHFLASPYEFDFDTSASYGFERTYISYGAYSTTNFYLPAGPTVYVISRGKSATVGVLVSSLSNVTLHMSFDFVRGLPTGVEAKLVPEVFILHPNEQVMLRLVLNVSNVATISKTPIIAPLTATTTQTLGFGEYVELALLADLHSYSLVKGFYLTII